MQLPAVNNGDRAKPRSDLWLCIVALTVTTIALRALGFYRLMRWISHSTWVRGDPEPMVSVTVGLLGRRIAEAGAILPWRARCLEQSVALYLMLRFYHLDARLRIGVQPFGFVAHAWVEYAGQPVNESDEVLRKVVVFPELVL